MDMFDTNIFEDAMECAKILLLCSTLSITLLAWRRNHDPFSPIKIYLIYSVFFYLGIYTQKVHWATIVVYFLLLLTIGICIAFEPRSDNTDRSEPVRTLNATKLYKIIWLLSVPGILVKLYFIYEAGGVLAYIFNLSFRVKDWAGKGHLVIWFYILPVLNLSYFCVVITDSEKKWRTRVLFACHFLIFLAIGLLTGSRSYIAIALLGMVVVYSFLTKRVRVKWMVLSGIGLIVLAGLIGAMRNNFGNDLEFSAMTNEQKFETAQTSYGIIPLEIIFDSQEKSLFYGSTYFSLLTNLIPRGIFPEKPDTGGIAFTKMYADDQWGGLSNLATGAVTEGVMNFGMFFGILFGVLLNSLFLYFGCKIYGKLLKCKKDNTLTIFRVAAYFYVVLAAARFSFSEFTDIFQTLFLYALIPLALLRFSARLPTHHGR